jgi:hypothetical protein
MQLLSSSTSRTLVPTADMPPSTAVPSLGIQSYLLSEFGNEARSDRERGSEAGRQAGGREGNTTAGIILSALSNLSCNAISQRGNQV